MFAYDQLDWHWKHIRHAVQGTLDLLNKDEYRGVRGDMTSPLKKILETLDWEERMHFGGRTKETTKRHLKNPPKRAA